MEHGESKDPSVFSQWYSIASVGVGATYCEVR